VPLEKIPYVDYPELRINKNESTEMPFRYVKGSSGEPIMPEVSQVLVLREYSLVNTEQGMVDLIKKDSEKGFGDLF